MLQAGQPAPPFELPDADMEMVSLANFKNKSNVVLYFYPKDDTPGCTIEAIDFSEMEEEFAKRKTVVIGVSRDDCISHAAFRDKHGLTVRLLADTDSEACDKYGVIQEKEVDGKKKQGIVRSTFIIDKQGVVRHALYGVSSRGHAAEVLNLIKGMK
ncbi:MAG: peroxiredoxin [Pseudomonadota bacterium]